MATAQANLPVRLDVFDAGGRQGGGTLPGLPAARPRRWRWISTTFDVDQGHAELVYDFRDGGEADGWLHALFRYEDRQSGHVAESSFGAHIFNTVDDLSRRAAILFAGRRRGFRTRCS